ncbi:hydroxymethylglutaryl-CoA synthase [Candidatus Woesebacteria bacterium RIFCSPHIGHO2_01_FULL_38_9]|uniref:Hydroxymethylglutaryl-CoA synthase n=2 Tax=Candidatus Woeseibacteriota TaxID=1752722 RepID=A0A1F7XZ25_9BACT|nr:MAG: hydroxymethylglutaryl-CoA synthase [Candidatus Woesebacteria bacterium RIFCSPHIGHO2_01_FULL_38_9]OGM58651.1 MAG: hydroxymethylglutaryl-CoA synthase [Candidatus Woesebacteria bacterium RIFCSPLOWO2_01_FULL_39_10]
MIKEKVGIVGYGVSIPYARLKTNDIAVAWERANNPGISLQVQEKAVPNFDEDTVTLSVEAAINALERGNIEADLIKAVYIGSESHPYAVKPSSGIVAEALGVNPFNFSADTEFACKAGTAAMQIVLGLVASGIIDYGLAIGADTAQAAPGDALEYSAAAGAGAYILGKERLLAKFIDTLSFTSDTPDFWRRPKEIYPKHGGRFTGKPAYFRHIQEATDAFLKKTNTKPKNYDHVVFHMPNGKFPRLIAKKLGFSDTQIQTGLIVDQIGNPYSAASMIGLARVLDNAKPEQMILVTSYGSGAGSDTLSLLTTRELPSARNKAKTTDQYISHKKYISYTRYTRMKGKLLI